MTNSNVLQVPTCCPEQNSVLTWFKKQCGEKLGSVYVVKEDKGFNINE